MKEKEYFFVYGTLKIIMKTKLKYFLVFVILLTNNLFGQTDKEVNATPQRPSISTSTTTTYPGWLELEAGVSLDEHLFDSPLVLKIGATRSFELFAGLSPLINVSNGNSETGVGDVVLGGRLRFNDGAETTPSFAGQFSIKLPTADEDKGLGSGEVDYNFLFILTHSVGEFALDVNTGLTFAGISNGRTDEQVLGILTLSRAMHSNFSGFGEIFVNHSFEIDTTVVVGAFGGSYTVNPRLILDAAVNFNISDAPFDLRILGGVTTTFAKVW